MLTACLVMKLSETWFAFTLTDLGVNLTFLPPSVFGFWLVFPLVSPLQREGGVLCRNDDILLVLVVLVASFLPCGQTI